MKPSIVVLVVAALGAGCGSRPDIGTFDATGFHHERLDYRIESQGGEVMAAGWRLDNYQLDGAGRPTHSKVGPDYRVRHRADLDGDGRASAMREVPAYDLRYRSTRDAGTVWVRTIPLPTDLADTELRVLMRLHVEAIAGHGLTFIDYGTGREAVAEHRFATRELDSAPRAVGGREAYAATIEVANLDQVELAPDARWERARIVLVRTELLWGYDNTFVTASQVRPILMVLGYSNLPEDFDAHAAEFESLVSRVVFGSPESDVARTAALACSSEPRVSFVALAFGMRTVVLSPGADDAQRSCLTRVVEQHRLVARGDRAYAFRRDPVVIPEVPAAEPSAESSHTGATSSEIVAAPAQSE